MPLSSYKNLGNTSLPWIGRIPLHWDVLPAFALFHEKCVRNGGLIEQDVLTLSYGQIKKKDVATKKGLLPASFETYQIVDPGDIILRLTDLQNDQRSLRVGFVKDRGIITSAYLCLEPRVKESSPFLYYLLHALDLQKAFYGMGAGLRQTMGFEDLRRLEIPLPPPTEQLGITRFLDQYTRLVERVLRTRKRQIQLLTEQKKIVVHLAVTRGLNPSVPLRSTGVQWVPDVPQHWTVVPLGQVAQMIQTGPFGSQLHASDYVPGGIPVINPTHLAGGRIVPDTKFAVDQSTVDKLSKHILRDGDIVFARRGELGRCALVRSTEAGWLCGTRSLQLRVKDGWFIPEFLQLVLSAQGVRDFLSLSSVGATMENLNGSIVSRIRVQCPPLEEQQRIVSYVSDITSHLDRLIERATREAALVSEYRVRVITDVVTGKLDVRSTEPFFSITDLLPNFDDDPESDDLTEAEEELEDETED